LDLDFWKGKKIFLTGHTGFKGGWMSLWLSYLGAEVFGYALDPPTEPNFFKSTNLPNKLNQSIKGDIRDVEYLTKSIKSIAPDIIFHFAAQPLVRQSYVNPIETFSTNVMGTVNLLESARQSSSIKAIVNITTDKCYENKEWFWSYRENDNLGGRDPYSSSKACSELVTSAYRDSFFNQIGIHIASVRAGNVIGGGDWAKDRLIPDILRSLDSNSILEIRSPNAIRPWQHVLEPLKGYLLLAEKMVKEGTKYAQSWNFGPNENENKSVSWIARYIKEVNPNFNWKINNEIQLHESKVLKLDSSKAKEELNWTPKWNLKTALNKIIEWHYAWKEGQNMGEFSLKQILEYNKQ